MDIKKNHRPCFFSHSPAPFSDDFHFSSIHENVEFYMNPVNSLKRGFHSGSQPPILVRMKIPHYTVFANAG